MGASIPNLEEDKNNPPPKSPATLPEKHTEDGDIEIKFVKNKKKVKAPVPVDLLAGEPELVNFFN